MEISSPVLCGGTFLTLLLQDRTQRKSPRAHTKGEHDNLSNQDVFFELIRIVKPNFLKPKNFGTITSQYKSCTGQIPEVSESLMIAAFDERIKKKYKTPLKAMECLANKFIDIDSSVGTHKKLVEALLELIEQDQSIEDKDDFYICPNGDPISKADMSGLIEECFDICLPAFLLGVWHFIIVNRKDNTIGVATYNRWHTEQPKGSKATRKYIGNIGSNYKRPINVSVEFPDDSSDKAEKVVINNNKSLPEQNSPLQNIVIPDRDIKAVSQNEPQPKRILEIFCRNIQNFNILGLIEIDPVNSLASYFFEDINHFIGSIKYNQKHENILGKEEESYQEIDEFTNILFEYIEYLGKQMKKVRILDNSNSNYFYNGYEPPFYERYEPPKDNNGEFEKTTLNFRQKLKSLHGKIYCNDI